MRKNLLKIPKISLIIIGFILSDFSNAQTLLDVNIGKAGTGVSNGSGPSVFINYAASPYWSIGLGYVRGGSEIAGLGYPSDISVDRNRFDLRVRPKINVLKSKLFFHPNLTCSYNSFSSEYRESYYKALSIGAGFQFEYFFSNRIGAFLGIQFDDLNPNIDTQTVASGAAPAGYTQDPSNGNIYGPTDISAYNEYIEISYGLTINLFRKKSL